MAQRLVRKGTIYLKNSGRITFFVNQPKKWVMTLMKGPGHVFPEDLRSILETFGMIHHRIYRKVVYTSKDSTMKRPRPNIIVQYSKLRSLPLHKMILDMRLTIEAIWTQPPKDMVEEEHFSDFEKEWHDLPEEIKVKHRRNTQQQQQTNAPNPVTTSKQIQENEVTKSKSTTQTTMQDTSNEKVSTTSIRSTSTSSNSKTPTVIENTPAIRSNNASAKLDETTSNAKNNTTTINKSTTPQTSKW